MTQRRQIALLDHIAPKSQHNHSLEVEDRHSIWVFNRETHWQTQPGWFNYFIAEIYNYIYLTRYEAHAQSVHI